MARYLRTATPNATEDELYEIVHQWFELYNDAIRTKDFGVTWSDFETAWDSVERPFCESLQELAANPAPLPDWMQGHRYGQRADRLLRICVTLAEHHAPEAFFLSARTAQALTGIDFSDCAKFFKVFVKKATLSPIRQTQSRARCGLRRVCVKHISTTLAALIQQEVNRNEQINHRLATRAVWKSKGAPTG